VLDLVSVGIGIVSGEAPAVSFFSGFTAGVAAYQIEEGAVSRGRTFASAGRGRASTHFVEVTTRLHGDLVLHFGNALCIGGGALG
jgi:hypothetical protein